MASRPSPSRRSWSSLLSVALVVSMSGFAPALAKTSPPTPIAKTPAARVVSGSNGIVADKLDATLAAAVAKATDKIAKVKYLDVAVLVDDGAAVPKGLERAIKLTLRADGGNDLWVGRVKTGSLVKMASAEQVGRVFENGRRESPPIPESTKPSKATRLKTARETKVKLDAARSAGVLDAFAAQFEEGSTAIKAPKIPGLDGGAATGWFDVGPNGHDSSGAWAQGYTGTGVRVAVADDSVDFAHPDLMGTQAYVKDPASPFYGWPEAFDPYSLLLHAYDQEYGTDYVAGGDSWFTDASATISETSPAYDGASDWVLPGTSLSGTYRIGRLWDEGLGYWWWGFPAVLVADTDSSGVYDTVYVDLDMDHDFTNDKPCTKSDPISYLDFWDSEGDASGMDGYADISGGMVYWIADGTNQPPGFDFMFKDVAGTPPAAGTMVCFMGALNLEETHGTLCASNVVGQGVTDGASDAYVDGGTYPAFKTPTGSGSGIVQGAAKDAELVAMSDIYWNHFSSTLAAYDYAAFGLDETAGTADDIQCVSNSYGESDDDADEWDYRSRYVSLLNTTYNPNVSYLFSTGNGAPGYGTNAPPTAATGIGVGASTQMGATGGWDSILDADQVNVGDVIPWSNRGPSAAGHMGPSVVADGAYSSGAIALNQSSGDGWRAWETWGGTSRSCPVATGNLALVFEAYKDVNGGWPDWETARGLFMNGAQDLEYDTFTQGAGMVDANRSVSLAAGNGGLTVDPSAWYPGDYRGTEYMSFVDLVHPGDSFADSLQIVNTGSSTANVTVTDSWLELQSTTTMTVTLDSAKESAYDFSRPDYLADITSLVQAADADLMVVKADESFAEFAPTGAFSTSATTHNVPRLLVYNWKDQNANSTLWTDGDSNGFVNAGEIDSGEYMRFTYANNFANSHQVRVQNPSSRMLDGVYLGLQHSTRTTSDPTVNVSIVIEFWSQVDHPWLSAGDNAFSLGAGSSMQLPVTVSVPADAPLGAYEGEYRIDDGTNVTVVPVSMTVAADSANFAFGDVAGAVNSIMPNGAMFGYQDWRWRAESGDWRFFMTDVPDEPALPEGAVWLVHTTWPELGAPTDMQADNDTQLYGPSLDEFSDMDPGVFGPTGLAKSGGSSNTNVTGGIWLPQTNTGTTEEWIAAPLGSGLNQIMLHNVVWPGQTDALPILGEAGMASVAPAALDLVDASDSGAEMIDFSTTMQLDGAAAKAYGLTKRLEGTYTVQQDASWTQEFALTDAAFIEVQTWCEDSDIDLYVYDGASNLIAGSESSSGDEHVRIDLPADDTYTVEVYGYSVFGGEDDFDISVSHPMGDDMSLSGISAGAIPADSGFELDVDWTKARSATLAEREGTYEGLVVLGPTAAPSAIQVPVTLRYPFAVETAWPSGKDVVETPKPEIQATFSKRVDPDSLSSDTFYVTDGATVFDASIGYDATTAQATITLDDPLASSTEFTVVVDGVMSLDGDMLSTEWTFSTIDSLFRSSGSDRYETAVAVSSSGFDAADVVVLATGADFPDALSAAGLAGSYDAPLLLTRPTNLPTIVRDEIVRLGASKVVIVGGTKAVSTGVVSAVDVLSGVSVERIAGTDRYATAAQVARAIALREGATPNAYVARGDSFPDALACSPYAFREAMPILLTRTTDLPSATRDAIEDLGVTDVVIAGGTPAVSDAVNNIIDGIGGVSVVRVAGLNRYETAAAVAEHGVSRGWGSWKYVGIATGLNFPDALVGGVACGNRGGVLLMSDPRFVSGATHATMLLRKSSILRVDIFGGTNVVSSDVAEALGMMLW